jgi:hypothetical protein
MRGRAVFTQEIEELSKDRHENVGSAHGVRLARPNVNRFMGFIIPKKPRAPGPDGTSLSSQKSCGD